MNAELTLKPSKRGGYLGTTVSDMDSEGKVWFYEEQSNIKIR